MRAKRNLFQCIVMPVLIQVVVMLSDLLILAAIAVCAYEWGLFGLMIASFLAIPPTRATGGFFFSWRPSNIQAFWTEWRKINATV